MVRNRWGQWYAASDDVWRWWEEREIYEDAVFCADCGIQATDERRSVIE